ncbi:hypothetical protein [Pseudomonas fluorescens]|uniref:Uncharacterized protein n=1 Tax=Pseudomonas fluorescens TaxID=294 RepID=A0A5E7D2B4_PSEFL|nr:hypothetical protein [Pseudomonas fluorescens]VVO11467.1 hypothetical protein PS710_03483 [Pseudomonas fluorescens]
MITEVAVAANAERTWAYPNEQRGIDMLSSLLDASSPPKAYQDTMYRIGRLLAEKLYEEHKLSSKSKVCIVSTVEDADFLSKGVYDTLSEKGQELYFVCVWNQRESMFDGGTTVAPIIRKFMQPGYENSDEMIVVKSIISGSCVVKTNITALFDKIRPKKIHVVSPVMHEDSAMKLLREFPSNYSELFDFEFLAKDRERNNNTGEVSPGIGGNVYERLGFANQADKNKYWPKLVRSMLHEM